MIKSRVLLVFTLLLFFSRRLITVWCAAAPYWCSDVTAGLALWDRYLRSRSFWTQSSEGKRFYSKFGRFNEQNQNSFLLHNVDMLYRLQDTQFSQFLSLCFPTSIKPHANPQCPSLVNLMLSFQGSFTILPGLTDGWMLYNFLLLQSVLLLLP